MKHRRKATGAAVLALLIAAAVPVTAQRNSLSEKDEIRKTFQLVDDNHRQLVVDNMSGEIAVTGYDGTAIELVVHREIKAEDSDKIGEAKRDVNLEMKQEKDKVILYVDAPWRDGEGMNYKGWHYYGYEVIYNFEIKVPRQISLYLKTVNHGKVLVRGVEGEFEVRNVNAGIEMSDITGSARVKTVNGPIKVSFTQNPKSGCSFKTVNGKIEVVLHDGLNADVKLKTFNGKVYSDFDVQALPRDNTTVEDRKGSRRIYRRGDSYAVRVGKGGPEFSFDTLNGSIYVLKGD
jgi:opacity protein-like surface antigen